MTLGMLTSFRLVPNMSSVQSTTIEPLIFPCYSVQTPFVFILDVDEVHTPDVDEVHTPDVDEVHTPDVDDVHTPDIQYVIREGRVARQQPPIAARPLEGSTSHEEVRRKNDEILRQLQSTHARISIWSLLASSTTHRDALI